MDHKIIHKSEKALEESKNTTRKHTMFTTKRRSVITQNYQHNWILPQQIPEHKRIRQPLVRHPEQQLKRALRYATICYRQESQWIYP